jgi:four helix bundle protein
VEFDWGTEVKRNQDARCLIPDNTKKEKHKIICKKMNYKDLEIWKLAREVVNEIHEMTINDLPKFEMFEEGNQVRRSSKSIKSNIVEGFGRRFYKQEFIKFLIYAHASNDEIKDHLETIFETKSLKDEIKFKSIYKKLDNLGKKLHNFIVSVEKEHKSIK